MRRVRLGTEPAPEVYTPLAQDWAPGRSMYVMVRTEVEPRSLVGSVRQQVSRLDASLPVYDVTTMEGIRESSLGQERFLALLLAAFAATGLALSTVGVYGVVSYTARRRQREIGIHMALGARRADVVSKIVGQGMVPVLAGLALGVAGSLAMGRLFSRVLYQIEPHDPGTITVDGRRADLRAPRASRRRRDGPLGFQGRHLLA